MVEFLLRRGAEPSLPDDPPWATPKAWAQRRGHDAIVRLLEEYERSGALPPRRLRALRGARAGSHGRYGPGDPAALQRIVDTSGRGARLRGIAPRTIPRVASAESGAGAVGHRRSAATTDTALATDDARWLIARAEGFERWDVWPVQSRVAGRSVMQPPPGADI